MLCIYILYVFKEREREIERGEYVLMVDGYHRRTLIEYFYGINEMINLKIAYDYIEPMQQCVLLY